MFCRTDPAKTTILFYLTQTPPRSVVGLFFSNGTKARLEVGGKGVVIGSAKKDGVLSPPGTIETTQGFAKNARGKKRR